MVAVHLGKGDGQALNTEKVKRKLTNVSSRTPEKLLNHANVLITTKAEGIYILYPNLQR